jgi:PAS domain S-box-containing protein
MLSVSSSAAGVWAVKMRMPWGLNVKHLYLAFFSIISIALCAFSLVIYDQYQKSQNLNDYMRYEYENIRRTKNILMDIIDMETGVRGYVLTGDKTYLAPYDVANDRLPGEIMALRQATYYESNAFAETNSLLDRVDSLQKLLESQINYMHAHGRGQVSLNALNIQRTQMYEVENVIEGSIAHRLASVKARRDLVEPRKTNFFYILVIGTILGVGIFLIGTILIIRLESEKEAFEAQNEGAEARFRAVMDGINDGVFELNFVNETIYMSKEFKALIGYDAHELDDDMHTLSAMIHPDDFESYMQVRHDYIIKKTPLYNNIFRLRHKDSTWRWMMARGVATWDKFGQIRTMIGTHTDITEQKNREEELRQLNNDMEAFTYITSHDMRSPLVNLKGFSHELSLAVQEVDDLLAPQRDKLDEGVWARLEHILRRDVPEALGFIGNAVDRMDTLTTAILDLSRIGKFVYRDELVDSRAVFDKCMGAQSYEIGNKNVEVTVGALPKLITDPIALEQVFSNLLDNAVKYLRPGEAGRIEMSCQETSRDYIFTLRDNGRGIDAEDSDRVFNIFRRARNTGDVRGLGLGMAFVKATLRKLNGAIWFESQLNIGTTFHVSLPKRQPVSASNDQSLHGEDAA